MAKKWAKEQYEEVTKIMERKKADQIYWALEWYKRCEVKHTDNDSQWELIMGQMQYP